MLSATYSSRRRKLTNSQGNNNLNFRLAREHVGDLKTSAKLCATPSQESSIFFSDSLEFEGK